MKAKKMKMNMEVKYLYTENYKIHEEDIINGETVFVHRLEKLIILE